MNSSTTSVGPAAAASTAGFVLGTAVDARAGYRPDWDRRDDASSPFFAGPRATVAEESWVADVGPGDWGDVSITLHDTAESILSAAFDITLLPGDGDGPATSFGSGALLTRNADRRSALATLKARFGVDFDVPGQGYALIEIRREADVQVHSSFSRGVFIRPRAFAAGNHPSTATLPAAEGDLAGAVGARGHSDIEEYQQYFTEHGTHYVASIATGDRILQVLAYDAAPWARLTADFANRPELLKGPHAAGSFASYARPRTPDGYGFVAQHGKVTILSDDPAFQASVAAGAWRDETWAQGDSALAPWLGGSIDLDDFTAVVPTAITLEPNSLLMDFARSTAAAQVFRAAMATIYAGYVAPAFPSLPDADFGGIYARGSGLLSALATPTVTGYVQRLDLSSVVLALPKVVKRLGVVANVLEVWGAAAALPGSEVTLLAGIVNVVAPDDGSVPTLTLADDAYAGFVMSCGTFTGGLYVRDAGGAHRRLIANGIVYERTTGPDGRYAAVVESDVRDLPPLPRVEAMSVQLTAAVNAAESLITGWQALAPEAGLELVTAFAAWVASLIPPSATGDLALLRLDALYLGRAAASLGGGRRQVPYLTFAAYKPAVDAISAATSTINRTIANYQDQIRARRQAELIVKDLDVLNRNVIETGKLLTGYIDAVAAQQREVAANSEALVAADRAALAQTQATIRTLHESLDAQRSVVRTAVEDYAEAVRKHALDQIVSLSLDVAKGVFQLGFSVATRTPQTSDAKQLVTLVEDIQRMVAMLAAVGKLVGAITKAPNAAAAASAFASLPAYGGPRVAGLKWDEFRTTMQNAIRKGPDLSARGNLEAAVEILVLRGQALIEAQANAAEIIGRLYREQRRQAIAADQQARLRKLDKLLQARVESLDVEAVDLVGLSGELAQQESALIVELVRAATMQDLALQYEYLQPPTRPPKTLDLISLGVYIAAQASALVKAKAALNPRPTQIREPVEYKVAGIPPHALAGGKPFAFQIPVSAPAFLNFTMVRVREVDVVVDGLESTDGGKFVVRTLYRGQPFHDVTPERCTVDFDTTPRITNFLGTVTRDGSSNASAGAERRGDYSQVTPFADWEVSFPAVKANEGIAFSGPTVDLTFRFHLEAQINPMVMLAAGSEPGGTAEQMLAGMQGQTCLMGWDAVFSYSETKVNEFLLAQYEAIRESEAAHLVIPLRTDETQPSPKTGAVQRYTWSMTLGPPRVKFDEGNRQFATVCLDVKAATFQYDIVNKDGSTTPVESMDKVPARSYIQGQAQLHHIEGAVKQQDVLLDLPAGTWTSGNLDVSAGNPTFHAFLTRQLASTSSKYRLGTLDLVSNVTLRALTPTAFRIAVAQTVSGQKLLQLFIVTDGTPPHQLALNNVPEPVPAGYDCSLLVSSRIMFDKILPAGFEGEGNKAGIALAGVAPIPKNAAWTAAATAGSVPVTVDEFGDGRNRVRVPGNRISVAFAGMSISAGASPAYNPVMSFRTGFRQPFDVCRCTNTWEMMCTKWEWVPAGGVDVTASAGAVLPVAISGTGQAQQLQVNKEQMSLDVDGSFSSGPCSDAAGGAVVKAFREASRPALMGAVPDVFPGISFFALKNLLFPAKNMVNMSLASVPGDLVILGTFAPGA